MIQLPEKGILLVPAHWHLPFYQEILEQKGNTLGIEMISLLSYVKRFIKKENPDEIALLYQAKELLQSIPEENDFYNSCSDADFLQAALSFIRWTKSEDVHSFPDTSEKQKQLKPILEKLDTLSLVEDLYPDIQLPEQENVYILEKVFSKQEQYWVDRLLEKGAQFLSFETTQTKEYYATSNAKKQARLIAEMIINKNWNAQDVSIHLCDSKDIPVTTQMMDAYKIPYTLLQQEQLSNVALQWSACLQWAQKPSIETLIPLLETCFDDTQDILAYLEECPDAYPSFQPRFTLAYQENTFLNAQEYANLQQLEQRALQWIQNHNLDWAFNDFETMASVIQQHIANPSKEDIVLFSSIQSLISNANAYIKKPEDLNILIQKIQECSKTQSATSLRGVCISMLNDLCGLKEHVFLLGATGQQFPALKIESGIFNEMYIKDLTLPSLESRLSKQKEQRFHTLNQAQHLIAIFPEANYDRKGNQTSIELNQWMNGKPKYIEIEESDVETYPTFSLSEKAIRSLLFDGQTLTSSVSALESYAKCPLQYFLKYGLRIRDNKDWSDIAQRGTLLHKILERSSQDYKKKYAEISKEQIQEYVQQEFAFVEKLYPHRQHEFTLSKKDIVSNLSFIFEKLAYFENHWQMNIDKEEYKYNIELPLDNCTLHLYGYVDRIDASESSFVVFDYKSGKRKFSKSEFLRGQALQLATYAIAYQEESGLLPRGSFYISLKPNVIDQIAYSINRRSMIVTPGKDQDQIEEESISSTPYTGILYQDLSSYHGGPEDSNTTSFEHQKEQWQQILQSIVRDIESGDVKPNHAKDACKYCQFESICRNARQEVDKEERIEVEA